MMTNIKDGYIVSVSGVGLTAEILDILKAVPSLPTGYGCRLKADTLEWEVYELPRIEENNIYFEAELLAMTNAELQSVLEEMKISGSMTKANMVALILQKQACSIE